MNTIIEVSPFHRIPHHKSGNLLTIYLHSIKHTPPDVKKIHCHCVLGATRDRGRGTLKTILNEDGQPPFYLFALLSAFLLVRLLHLSHE